MITEEQIAAYADDQLEGDEKARVEAAIAADPALAAKVDGHRALKAQLTGHYAPILDQPVPDHLAAMLSGKSDAAQDKTNGEVVSFAKERQKRGLAPTLRRWAPIAGPALAASLVLAIFQPWQTSPPLEGYAGEELASALDTQLAATQDADAATRVLLSFENEAGEYCRAYQSEGEGGIACRDAQGWEIERQFALQESQVTEFRQAGSLSDIMAAAQAMAPSGALDAAAEASAREQGWRK
ncbi:hypothetical protein MWU38_04005 [Qipengyuania sp. S6317L1]|uniref:hypothetical protein n=1 Tax=Qipengyuania sp. S6317L1 TaxID=2926410 RepID=UPI001FF3606D|nr:hypothetical protein [Qipengyuania sp. S6317L1]MCK0098540.1 hypothetical protein [Qipengyuania sp. S6317L1]